MNKKTVLIAGGGTGGHIYPGIAIAKAVQKKQPDVEVHFVGTSAGLEGQIVPREGFPLHFVKVGKLNYSGGLLGKLKTLLLLPVGFIQAISLLLELKPSLVLGVGGYASGPVVLIASLMGFPTAIWEPNAFPGMTNRWLSRFVDRCFVVFEDAMSYLNCEDKRKVGLPVRAEVEAIGSQARVASDEFHILVFGGSQGARAINNAVAEAVAMGGDWLKGVRLVHQTGRYDFERIKSIYQQNVQAAVDCREYLHDMEKQYSWADLVICRAGASTVAEIAACRKPAIFIPLPTAADDHQRKNAESLVEKRAAQMLLQKDLTPQSLIQLIEQVKKDTQSQQEMRENLRHFHQNQAAEKIAELILD